MKIQETVTIEKEVYVAPCIKCKSDKIDIYDCGYSTFNIGGGRCTGCGFKVSTDVGTWPKKEDLIGIWNSENNVKTLISKLKDTIKAAQKQIRDLNKGYTLP